MLDLSVVSQLILTVSAVTGAVVAVAGLTTWRKQLRGRTEYDLARKLLRAVLQVRDEIRFVRSPFILAGEFLAAYRAENQEPPATGVSGQEGLRLVYHHRWRQLQAALSDLRVDLVEGEVHWGEPLRRLGDRLWRKISELHSAMELYMQDIEHEPRDERGRVRHEEHFAIVHAGASGGTPDGFESDVLAIVSGFEELLRPALRL